MGLPNGTSTARPNAEQPRWALAYGDALLQLISVCFYGDDARRPPCGTVVAFDSKRGQILYSRRRDEVSSQPCHAQGVLSLTGPYRAISAEGRVSIELNLYEGSDQDAVLDSEDEAESSISGILWDVYSENAEYDRPIEQWFYTRYGRAVVTYIALSNAAEGSLEARLVRGGETTHSSLHGRISIYYSSPTDDDVVVLFDRELRATTPLEELYDVPLARAVIAAPLEEILKVEVDLRDQSGNEIVRGSEEVIPSLEKHDTLSLPGANGHMVEVTITWSD